MSSLPSGGAVLWVAAGSAIGGVARYLGSGIVARGAGESFPWGTLLVNVTGSLLIGLLATLMAPEGRWLAEPALRQFLLVGVLGGFTTFSSFSLESVRLMQQGEWSLASAYVLGSVGACLLGVWLGHGAGLLLNR